jgi:hypothetical protein
VTTVFFQNGTWWTPVAYSFQIAGDGFQNRRTERCAYSWLAGVSWSCRVSTTFSMSGESPWAMAASTICPPPCLGQNVG